MRISYKPALVSVKEDIFQKGNYVMHKVDNTLVKVLQSTEGKIFSGLVILQSYSNQSYSNLSQFFMKEDFQEYKGKIIIEI